MVSDTEIAEASKLQRNCYRETVIQYQHGSGRAVRGSASRRCSRHFAAFEQETTRSSHFVSSQYQNFIFDHRSMEKYQYCLLFFLSQGSAERLIWSFSTRLEGFGLAEYGRLGLILPRGAKKKKLWLQHSWDSPKMRTPELHFHRPSRPSPPSPPSPVPTAPSPQPPTAPASTQLEQHCQGSHHQQEASNQTQK